MDRRDDQESSETEAFLPINLPSHKLEDSFDSSVLTASSNPDSMGMLGKYEVLGVIGQGGMGVVLKAYDASLGRHVAIKVLSRRLATSMTARRRFAREARAAAAISHPNVITIHAVEEQEGAPYLVMEFMDGGSLSDRIKSAAPLPLAEILRFGAQIAAGLAAAHAQGVIHRDIKPGNVMLESQVDRVKITDFGLARITLDNSDLTSHQHGVGTPAYMSPEQVQGQKVDDRTDLFSLGCVLSAMITGASPFRGAHVFDAARKIMEETPLPLHELNPDVPPFLGEMISKLLEKDPQKRFQSAAEVAEIFHHYLARLNQSRTDDLHLLNHQSLKLKRPAKLGTSGGRAVLLLAVIALVAASPWWWGLIKQPDNQTARIDTKSTEPPSDPPLTTKVDLLDRIDLDHDVLSGRGWRIADGHLVTGVGRGAKLQIPYAGLTNYELQIVTTRRSGAGPLVIGLIVGESQCYVLIDAARGSGRSVTGFGLTLDDRLVASTNQISLPQDEEILIACRVTPQTLNISIGGSKVVDWQGQSTDLKLGAGWHVPNHEAFFIGTNDDAVFEINMLELSPLTETTAGAG